MAALSVTWPQAVSWRLRRPLLGDQRGTPLPKAIRAATEAQARAYETLLDTPVEVSWVERLVSG